jgi:hypothetical protein
MSAITITEAQVLLFEALCLPKWSSLVVGSVSCSGKRPPRLHDKGPACSPRIGQASRPGCRSSGNDSRLASGARTSRSTITKVNPEQAFQSRGVGGCRQIWPLYPTSIRVIPLSN